MLIENSIILDVSHYQWDGFLKANLGYFSFNKKQIYDIAEINSGQFSEFICFISKTLESNFKKKNESYFLVYHKQFFKISLKIKSDFFCIIDFSGVIEPIRKNHPYYSDLLNYSTILLEKQYFEKAFPIDGNIKKIKI